MGGGGGGGREGKSDVAGRQGWRGSREGRARACCSPHLYPGALSHRDPFAAAAAAAAAAGLVSLAIIMLLQRTMVWR